MSQTPLDFLNLFVESPGDLLYFLVVIAVSQAALFMSFGHRSRFPYEVTAQRYVVGAFALVGVWVLLLAGALLSLLLSQNPNVILPPLERLAYAITLLMLSWAFLGSSEIPIGRQSNLILIIAIGISVIFYIVTAIQWRNLSMMIPVFNLTIFAPFWSFIVTLIALVSLLVLITRFATIVDAPIKSVFFLLIIFGNAFNLIQFSQGQVLGNYLGSSRLAYVTALVMVPLIIYRMVVSYLENSMTEVALAASQPSTVSNEIVSNDTDSAVVVPTHVNALHHPSSAETQSVQLLKVIGLILEAEENSKIPERIIKATVDVLRVDIGVLVQIQDANYADLMFGFDRVMNRPISGVSLSLQEQPTLVNAIERRAQRALFLERNTEELDDLYRRLDINQYGPIYIQPLIKQQELVGVLIVGLPYQQREFNVSESELLKGIGIIASSLLALSLEANEAQILAEERAIQAMIEGVPISSIGDSDVVNARREMEASLQLARDQINQLSQQVGKLKLQLDAERRRVLELLGDNNDGDLSVSQRIEVIFSEQERLRDERDHLTHELIEAETALSTLTSQDDEALAHDITESLRREYDLLVSARDHLRRQIDDLRAKDKTVINEDMQSIIQSMSAETTRLETERNQLSDKLMNIQSQLNNLGVEGGIASLTHVVAQLYAERKTLNKRVETLQRERELLLNERKGSNSHNVNIQQLQKQIKYLASDRETFLKLRERMRSDYKDLLSKYEQGREQRRVLKDKLKELISDSSLVRNENEKLHQQIKSLSDERSHLLKIRDQLESQLNSMKAETSLVETDGNSQIIIQEQLIALQSMIRDLTEQREKLELELNYTQTALAEARNQNDQMQIAQSNDFEDEVKYTLNNPELFVGLVQELRTPMTSIAGYIELLLGESAGILGEMQRNFLQRVSVNIHRLTSMIDDLVKITQLDAGGFELERLPVDLVGLVEEEITNASNQFREKGLVVNLSLNDSLPSIPADYDGIRQIIGQLLTNAYLVSPSGSEIWVRAFSDKLKLPNVEEPEEVLLFVVEDRGGGILADDIPRVFARKYKAENPLIEGLGDTGVGMSIAKAFAEAHGGHIWVESQIGVGSTFSVALPVSMNLVGEE